MIGELPLGVIEDEKGNAELPPERFKNYHEVQETCNAMISADRQMRSPERARVDGLIAGNQPINPTALANKGFGWMPNANYLEAEGFIGAAQSPLFDLVTETDHCIDVTLDVKAESNDQRQDWENSIQKHFTWLMFNRWRKGFNYAIPMQQLQMLKHGIGFHLRMTKSWIPRTPRAGNVLFPSNAPINFDEDGEYFMMRDFVPAQSLYQWIRNESVANKLGWRTKAVWKALANTTKAYKSPSSPEQVQRQMRNGDIGWSQARQSGVWINYLPVKEIDTGKISLYVVTDSTAEDPGDYLFVKRNAFESFPINIFNYDIGDGDLNSVRGLGQRTRVFFELSNRLNNAMAAQVIMSMFPMVRNTSGDTDPDRLKLVRLGALGVLPKDVTLEQIQWPPLNNGPLALTRELRQTVESNNQPMTGDVPEPKDRETAFSFNMRSQQSARVSNGLQSLYESNLQGFYDDTVRAVLDSPKGDLPYQKMAEEFRERCRKDGVPEAALKSRNVAEVQEVTSTGAGSAAVRLQALQALMQYIYPSTTEGKKITIERDLTSALMGGAKVDRYARSLSDSDIPNSDDSMATVESGTLSTGGDAQVSTGQNDVKHVGNHLGKAQQIEQAVKAGQMEPAQALTALQKLLDHAGAHLDRLQTNTNRKAEFDQLSSQWEEIARFAKQLQAEVEQRAQETPPEQQLSEDSQVKMAQVQQDGAIKDKKADADIQRNFRKDALKGRLATASTQAKILTQVAGSRNGSRQPQSA